MSKAGIHEAAGRFISSVPEVPGGKPVFSGTRAPTAPRWSGNSHTAARQLNEWPLAKESPTSIALAMSPVLRCDIASAGIVAWSSSRRSGEISAALE